jgi:hypothetical protein
MVMNAFPLLCTHGCHSLIVWATLLLQDDLSMAQRWMLDQLCHHTLSVDRR